LSLNQSAHLVSAAEKVPIGVALVPVGDTNQVSSLSGRDHGIHGGRHKVRVADVVANNELSCLRAGLLESLSLKLGLILYLVERIQGHCSQS